MALASSILGAIRAGIEAVPLTPWPAGPKPTTRFRAIRVAEFDAEHGSPRGFRIQPVAAPVDTEMSTTTSRQYRITFTVQAQYPAVGDDFDAVGVMFDDVQRLTADLTAIGAGGPGSAAMITALGADSGALHRLDIRPRGPLSIFNADTGLLAKYVMESDFEAIFNGNLP